MRGADQHVLVVAFETGDALRRVRLRLDQEIDDLAAALAAIDIIAEKNNPCVVVAGTVAAMIVAMAQQIGELGEAAMDVADRVGQVCRHAIPRRLKAVMEGVWRRKWSKV